MRHRSLVRVWNARGWEGPVMGPRQGEQAVFTIGQSVVIKGDLTGSENLTIEGEVEGRIDLRDHVLTIGPNGKIRAEVFAKSVIVLGKVTGTVTASEKVDIRETGWVEGDLVALRLAMADGAHFQGRVNMQRPGSGDTARG